MGNRFCLMGGVAICYFGKMPQGIVQDKIYVGVPTKVCTTAGSMKAPDINIYRATIFKVPCSIFTYKVASKDVLSV